MAKIKVISQKGVEVKDLTLNDTVWNIEPNNVVLKKAVDLQLAAMRQGTKATKSVGMVSGSGKKPHKQKGTGRARVGQKRNPVWTGGGHTFALTNRDYGFKMNKKERVLALKSALSTKYQGKELVVVDDIKLSTLRTAEVKSLIKDLKLSGKVLFVTSEDNENLYMAARNIGHTYVLMASEINVYDIINSDVIVVDEASVVKIEEVLK